jgi:hypothetical protein
MHEAVCQEMCQVVTLLTSLHNQPFVYNTHIYSFSFCSYLLTYYYAFSLSSYLFSFMPPQPTNFATLGYHLFFVVVKPAVITWFVR